MTGGGLDYGLPPTGPLFCSLSSKRPNYIQGQSPLKTWITKPIESSTESGSHHLIKAHAYTDLL